MGESKLVLVIDEDDDDREYLAEIIRSVRSGVELVADKSCQGAISKFRSKVYSLPAAVFLGMSSPPDPGLECLSSLRSELPGSLPIYVVSSLLTRKVTQAIMNAGGSGVLDKSADFRALKAQIERAVNIS